MSFPWSCSPTTAIGPTPVLQVWPAAELLLLPLSSHFLSEASHRALSSASACPFLAWQKLLPDFLNSDTVCKSFAQPTFAENFTEQQTLSLASGLYAGPFFLFVTFQYSVSSSQAQDTPVAMLRPFPPLMKHPRPRNPEMGKGGRMHSTFFKSLSGFHYL